MPCPVYFRKYVAAIFCLLIALPLPAGAADPLTQLKSMSLESLMQIEVFSASKQSEQLADVAAAMHVITREDIRRSGARTLPDALRGVPGLTVANMDGHTWAITARGFNGLFANKLLVLMDGRVLYTPLFSGVYWDMQDTVLEDIERIEVIRGPGATIWGANAVNGVINIITRHASKSDGLYVQAGGGSLDRSTVSARVGDVLGEGLSYRMYAKYLDRDDTVNFYGPGDHHDSWQNEMGGFRFDWDTPTDHQLSVSGEIYQGDAGQVITYFDNVRFPAEVEYSGGHLQLQWQKDISDRSKWTVLSYLDRSLRNDTFLDQTRTNWDLSFTHLYDLTSNQTLIWGGGYHYTTDSTSSGLASGMNPDSEREHVFNLFLQDDLSLLEDRLHVILGSKLEHNGFTGFEVQPTARMVWSLSDTSRLWAAVSRATRTPARIDRDMVASAVVEQIEIPLNGQLIPANIRLDMSGNTDINAEEMFAYELGFRSQPADSLSLDLALFYNKYDGIRTQEGGEPLIDLTTDPAEMIVPVTFYNGLDMETFGAEVSATWQGLDFWRLRGGYSWLKMNQLAGPPEDPFQEMIEELNAEHQFSIKSNLDLPWNFEWDTSVYYFSDFHNTPSHTRCDMRLGWMPSTSWEASLSVENLFDNEYREFPSNLSVVASDMTRNWFLNIAYRY